MQCAGSSPRDAQSLIGDRSELTMSIDTSGSSEVTSPKALTFDLLNMVVSYKRMIIFLEPIMDTVEVLRYLLRWKMPLISVTSFVLLNIIFLTLSEGAWISLLLLCISTPALLGFAGERCQGATTEAAVQKKNHCAVQRRDLQTVHMSKQEAMLEVKGMLKQIDDLLTQTCSCAESVYKVLYWESHSVSIMFYGFLLTAVCLLCTSPVGLSLSVLNSILFLFNKDFCRVLLELRDFVFPPRVLASEEVEACDSCQETLLEQTPTPTSVEDLSPSNIEEAEEAEPDDEFKDAIEESQLVLPDDEDVSQAGLDFDAVSDNGLLSRNEPIRSKVSKLTEKLRKRVPSNTAGNCFQCNSAFSVLKKRRNCSNCGVSFCSRCCSYKVFRSTMGATAPEAQRETVFVCVTCNALLCSK